LTVFVFFGLVAVTGTEWVLTGSVGRVTLIGVNSDGQLGRRRPGGQ